MEFQTTLLARPSERGACPCLPITLLTSPSSPCYTMQRQNQKLVESLLWCTWGDSPQSHANVGLPNYIITANVPSPQLGARGPDAEGLMHLEIRGGVTEPLSGSPREASASAPSSPSAHYCRQKAVAKIIKNDRVHRVARPSQSGGFKNPGPIKQHPPTACSRHSGTGRGCSLSENPAALPIDTPGCPN